MSDALVALSAARRGRAERALWLLNLQRRGSVRRVVD